MPRAPLVEWVEPGAMPGRNAGLQIDRHGIVSQELVKVSGDIRFLFDDHAIPPYEECPRSRTLRKVRVISFVTLHPAGTSQEPILNAFHCGPDGGRIQVNGPDQSIKATGVC